MASRIAFLFPGQGSQVVGMGKDLAENSQRAREVFDKVDHICSKPISRLCFEGPMAELTLTHNLQPAITAVSLALLALLEEEGVRPHISAGHSLGEYSALVASGVIGEEDALGLVHKRGVLMQREAELNPGGMVAVIGLKIMEVEEIILSASERGIISVANHNSEQQIVLTGAKEALLSASKMVKERGGKAIPLKVSGAWHSELMRGAVEEFRRFMDDIEFSPPKAMVLFNATASTEKNPEAIKDLMALQLISRVRWYEIMKNMLTDGVEVFAEVGPKNVLAGLLKKTVPKGDGIRIYNVDSLSSLKEFVASI